MKNFEVGDVVQLASGGPKMTVICDGNAANHVFCRWFLPDGTHQGYEFLEGALVKAPGHVSGGQGQAPPGSRFP